MIGVRFQKTGSDARKGDRIRTIANCSAIFGTNEIAIQLRCPCISWWQIGECLVDERPRGCVGYEPRRVAGCCRG